MHSSPRRRALPTVAWRGAGALGALLGLALAAGPLHGQGPDSPAAEDAWWRELGGPGPGLHVIEVDSTYRIRGHDYDDLLREMRRKGPGTDEIGTRLGVHVARWRWSYDYWTGGRNGRCRVTDVSVALRSIIVLPEWVREPGASADLVRRWPRFRDALVEHEMGHRNRARAQGVVLWQSLLGLQAETCEELRTLVSETATRVVSEGEAAQLEYDRDTAHGLRQGAVWPP